MCARTYVQFGYPIVTGGKEGKGRNGTERKDRKRTGGRAAETLTPGGGVESHTDRTPARATMV